MVTLRDVAIVTARTEQEFMEVSVMLDEYFDWIESELSIDVFREQPGAVGELLSPQVAYGGLGSGVFLALKGGVAGMVAVVRHDARRAQIKRLYVRPAFRGRGIARRLVGAALTAPWVAGVDVIELESFRGLMDGAIRIYEAFGFREIPAARQLPGLIAMERRRSAGVSGLVGTSSPG